MEQSRLCQVLPQCLGLPQSGTQVAYFLVGQLLVLVPMSALIES